MSISEKIDEIISARKSKIKNIKKSKDSIENISKVIGDFEDFRDSLEDDNSFDNIKNIDVKKLREECENINKELERLEKRFSREHIHLTFVGQMGTGKSLVMQRISGLDDTIIPSGDGPSCTGAKSIITNTDNEDVEAKITFFTENEIVDIVNKYLKTIFGEGKIPKVNSILDIKKISINDLPKSKDESVKKNKKEHLEKYIEHIDDFKEYLGEKDKIVKKDDIKKYVAQYNTKNTNEKYFNFLAVKEANIYCPFRFKDCGKIVLIDTVGLGETSLGVEAKMFEAVKNNADAIIYMVSPDLKRYEITEGHHKTLDKIIKEVSSEYTEKMLFWIVNKNNQDGGPAYKEEIPKLVAKLEKTRKEDGLAICKALEVDCNDRDEVEEKLLKPILNQISSNLEDIDNLLLSKAQQMTEKFFGDYSNFVKKVEKNSENFIISSSAFKQKFDKLINFIFEKKLTSNLQLFSSKYEKYIAKDKDDEDLKKSFIEQLKKIYKELPNDEQINKIFNNSGDDPNNIFKNMFNAIRISIINNFLKLDELLIKKVNNFKMEIVHILADDDKGKFEHILPICDDPNYWLGEFLKKIGNEDEFKYIYDTVETLKDFTLTTKNYLIYEIRNSLNKIDPLKSIISLDLRLYEKDYKSDIIKEQISRYVDSIYDTIKENSSNYLKFYDKAFFAVARNFYDRVRFWFTLDLENGLIENKSEEQWKYLYWKYLSKIWSEEYNEFQKKSKKSEFFKDIIEKLKSVD